MAPTSKIFLTRHAQAEHNVLLAENRREEGYVILDSPLTSLGKKQAASLPARIPQEQLVVDVVLSSPLKRTLQTTYLGWGPAVERLGGREKVVCLPEAQECNDVPCDTGSSREVLEADPELAGFDFSGLTPDWTSKKGFWGASPAELANRAQRVRQIIRDRPEANIVLVAHGDILRRITSRGVDPTTEDWKNAEVRIYEFDPAAVDTDGCFLRPSVDEHGVARVVAGGYGPTSSEADFDN